METMMTYSLHVEKHGTILRVSSFVRSAIPNGYRTRINQNAYNSSTRNLGQARLGRDSALLGMVSTTLGSATR